jgi:acetyl-CoA synthetase (ADP-forming)
MTESRRALVELLKRGGTTLTLRESRDLLEDIGIPFNRAVFATSAEEVQRNARALQFPLAMKVVSADILHKTDVGGVRTNIGSMTELLQAYDEMMTSVRTRASGAALEGVMVEEMVEGTELIVGITTDPVFGHLIMFGIGGILVETYQDVSFRLVPVTRGEVERMFREIKGQRLLEGFRSLPRVDRKQLVDIILKISDFVSENPEVREMDINPLMATSKGLIAVDARVLLAGEAVSPA